MAYIKAIDGYIVDVPNATFTRCDDKRFYFNKLASCNFSPTIEPLIINGGQGMYPLAYIPSSATAEVTMTSAEFRADLFEMAHAVNAEATTTDTIIETRNFDIPAGLTVKLPDGASDIYISGLELTTSTLAAGKYTAAHVAASGTEPNVVPAHELVTFFAGDVAEGDVVEISYELIVSGTLIPVSGDGASAKGTLQLDYPVYSSGKDCTDASRKGTLSLTIYRVRVSAMPGFDSSLSYRFPAQKCA